MPFTAPALELLSERLVAFRGAGGLDAQRPRLERRARGAFFTPQPLVDFMVEDVLEAYCQTQDLEWTEAGYPRLRILDPSAGDGRFLLAAASWLVERGGKRANQEAIKRNCLIAIERDPHYAEALREGLGSGAQVHCCEALGARVVANQSIDLLLGNPPYQRSIHLAESDPSLHAALRGKYDATSHGEWDLYAAFLEQGINWLAPRGQLGLVLPSRWWTAQWAGPLRKRLARRAHLRALVDFGATQVFANATVYASVCFASAGKNTSIQVARSQQGSKWQVGAVMTTELTAAPWSLLVGPAREVAATLKAAGPRLGELAQICKGAGTNADAVFVITDPATVIETSLLRPLLRGRDVKSFGETPSWPRLLVPYDIDGKLIEPRQMRRCFPRAYAYLCDHREQLEKREKGRFAGENFYRYGRPQNMRFHGLSEAKIVVPDIVKEGRALIDTQMSMVLDSAYALRPLVGSEIDIFSLCGILNSRVVSLWLTQQGMTLRGGYTRMKTLFLRELPIPRAGVKRQAISDAVRARLPNAEIDERVRLAYGLNLADWAGAEFDR